MTDTAWEPDNAQPRTGRRWALVGIGAVAVVGVVGGAAWGVASLFGSGPAPATALPADALAYLALDLDPGGGQKVEAYRTMRKFPALDDALGSRDDLTSALVEEILDEARCEDLETEDITAWVGDRMAVAVLPGAEQPAPLVVLQVTDREAAEAGVRELVACGEDAVAEGQPEAGSEEQPGMAFVDDYLLLAEDDEVASQAAESAGDAALEDDETFRRWVDEAGGAGILTGYLAPDAPAVLLDQIFGAGFSGSYVEEPEIQPRIEPDVEPNVEPGVEPGVEPSSEPSADPAAVLGRSAPALAESSDAPATPTSPDSSPLPVEPVEPQFPVEPQLPINPLFPGGDPEALEEALDDFEGAAMSVRFEDGGLDVEMAAQAGAQLAGGGDSGLVDLPSSTAVAFGFGVPDDFAETMTEGLRGTDQGLGGADLESMLEAETGLSLPEDLQALLGDGVAFAVDSSLDPAAFADGPVVPADLPLGLRISGDPDSIVPVIERLLATVEQEPGAPAADEIVVESGDGVVAVGLDAEYVATLAEDGDLGDQDGFTRALPDLAPDAGALYVDFDAEGWVEAATDDDSEGRENLEPLSTLGVQGVVEDDEVFRMRLRLSTD